MTLKTIKQILILVLSILLILISADFIKFKITIKIIRENMPTNGFDTPLVFPSYRPFLWGRPVNGLTYRSMGKDEIEKPLYIHFRIGEHQAITVWLNGENWFDYKVQEREEETENNWYKQEFTSLTGFVKLLQHQEYYDKDFNKISKAKILYYIETDTQKIYFTVQNIMLYRGGCDGGYWYGTVGTPY
jgi:hypothetical protein